MFTFLAPQSLGDAQQILAEKKELRILAGGTDVMVLLRAGALCPHTVMDVKKIPELQVFTYTQNGLEIGGAVTCNQVIEADFLDPAHDIMRQAAETLANTLLRNRATVVGNLCNASPGGDMITPALVLGGYLVAASPRGVREIPLSGFFTGVKKHVLEADEMVLKLVLPRVNGRGIYLKKRRIRGHDLAQVGVSGLYTEEGELRLALGAVGPTPVLLDDLGRFAKDDLRQHKPDIIKRVTAAASPISDVRCGRDYRVAMLRLFTGRIVDAFFSGEEVVR